MKTFATIVVDRRNESNRHLLRGLAGDNPIHPAFDRIRFVFYAIDGRNCVAVLAACSSPRDDIGKSIQGNLAESDGDPP
jgi:hypothetical protein